MTIKEVIKNQFGYNIPDATLLTAISERGLDPAAERITTDQAQSKGIDLSKADLIDFVITRPKTVRELDYQITQQDADALLAVRRRLLAKWGEDDEPSDSGFIDISNTH